MIKDEIKKRKRERNIADPIKMGSKKTSAYSYTISEEDGTEWEIEIMDGTHLRYRMVGGNGNWAIPQHIGQLSDWMKLALKEKGVIEGNFFKEASLKQASDQDIYEVVSGNDTFTGTKEDIRKQMETYDFNEEDINWALDNATLVKSASLKKAVDGTDYNSLDQNQGHGNRQMPVAGNGFIPSDDSKVDKTMTMEEALNVVRTKEDTENMSVEQVEQEALKVMNEFNSITASILRLPYNKRTASLFKPVGNDGYFMKRAGKDDKNLVWYIYEDNAGRKFIARKRRPTDTFK